MRSLSSRESYGTVTQALLSAAANLDDGGVQGLGNDITSVASLLEREVALRRAVSDSSVPADSRGQLAGRIFGGKISGAASAVLDRVVRAEWAGGRDLVLALQQLGRTAMFLRAERAGELDRIEDEIFRFGRVVEANPQLAGLLDDVTADPEAKVRLVRGLLDGKAHSLTVELITGLAANQHGRSFGYGVDELVEEAAQRNENAVAVVTSPVQLSDEQHARLTAALAKLFHRPVVIHVEVEPDLLGGMVVRVGDEVIDGSVSGRIDEIKARLGS